MSHEIIITDLPTIRAALKEAIHGTPLRYRTPEDAHNEAKLLKKKTRPVVTNPKTRKELNKD